MIPTFWKHIPHVRQWMHWKPSPITVSLLPRSNTTVARTYKFAGRENKFSNFPFYLVTAPWLLLVDLPTLKREVLTSVCFLLPNLLPACRRETSEAAPSIAKP